MIWQLRSEQLEVERVRIPIQPPEGVSSEAGCDVLCCFFLSRINANMNNATGPNLFASVALFHTEILDTKGYPPKRTR